MEDALNADNAATHKRHLQFQSESDNSKSVASNEAEKTALDEEPSENAETSANSITTASKIISKLESVSMDEIPQDDKKVVQELYNKESEDGFASEAVPEAQRDTRNTGVQISDNNSTAESTISRKEFGLVSEVKSDDERESCLKLEPEFSKLSIKDSEDEDSEDEGSEEVANSYQPLEIVLQNPLFSQVAVENRANKMLKNDPESKIYDELDLLHSFCKSMKSSFEKFEPNDDEPYGADQDIDTLLLSGQHINSFYRSMKSSFEKFKPNDEEPDADQDMDTRPVRGRNINSFYETMKWSFEKFKQNEKPDADQDIDNRLLSGRDINRDILDNPIELDENRISGLNNVIKQAEIYQEYLVFLKNCRQSSEDSNGWKKAVPKEEDIIVLLERDKFDFDLLDEGVKRDWCNNLEVVELLVYITRKLITFYQETPGDVSLRALKIHLDFAQTVEGYLEYFQGYIRRQFAQILTCSLIKQLIDLMENLYNILREDNFSISKLCDHYLNSLVLGYDTSRELF